VSAEPTALVFVRAPRAGTVKRALEPWLGPAGCAGLQAALVRRAAAWAGAAAPGAAWLAVDPPDAVAEVAALAGPGVAVIAQSGAGLHERLAAAVARVAGGPLLLAGSDCPRLGAAHAAAALSDLATGCDAVVGTTLDGDWYLAALAAPRPDLLALAPDRAARPDGFGRMLATAHALGAEVGVLRHERALRTPDDMAAHLADPLLAPELRAALTPSGP
jgi:glycosyltransferase A (GT-A) superfamily protein (DUF2064 family)